MNKLAPILLVLFFPIANASNQTELKINNGWNMLGNDSATYTDVASYFGNTSKPTPWTSKVQTIWTWDSVNSKWNFYTPSLSATDLSSYAQQKGYSVLTTIPKGAGFWINFKNFTQTELDQINNSAPVKEVTNTNSTSWNDIRFNSITYAMNNLDMCYATLNFTNTGAVSKGFSAVHDIIVNKVVVGQVSFISLGISPNKTGEITVFVQTSAAVKLACGTFTLEFNSFASQLF